MVINATAVKPYFGEVLQLIGKPAVLEIPAQFSALAQITPFILKAVDVGPAQLRENLALAVHELCTNIIQHGYAGTSGSIVIRTERDSDSLNITITDEAPNAYSRARNIPPDPLDMPEGGWGMHIIRQFVDDVYYERLEHGNFWQLTKYLESSC